ncbi:MAG: DHHA1 domain-containing protein [Chloroflexota bacterium]|nr:DHHA1 domain-containing protein [Chloroflexota bacterium]
MTMNSIPAPMWTEATHAVQSANRLLLVTHVEPDGDAIGSMLGLGLALRALGKTVDVAVDGGVPSYLRYIPGSDTVLEKLKTGAWDVMISLDSSDEARTGDCGAYGRANSPVVINLDHHQSNTGFGHIHLVNAAAVSATEVVQDWLPYLGQPLTPDIATALMTGLVTDTIGFRVSSVQPRTLLLAAALMQAGAPMYDIIQRTLNSKDFRDIQLWQQALPSVTLQDGVISGVVRVADWKAVGMDDTTDSGLVGYLITTDEARVAVVYKEKVSGEVEVSLRSKPGYDVSTVAFELGGGGHKQASGATVPGPVDEAIARVAPLLLAIANPQ